MGSSEIKSSTVEKDLRVLFDSNIKFSSQCTVAARNANRILGLIRRLIKIIQKFSETAFRVLYTSLESLFEERCSIT
jgi:hypothetical protein